MTLVRKAALFVAAVLLALTGCTGSEPADPVAPESEVAQEFPDVLEVVVSEESEGSYSFDVTISSPYDSPERYADGWRVRSEDGEVYGEMTLDHDHASEQPFTRTQSGVDIPAEVTSVVVEGRDLANGYGGDTQTVELP